MSCDRTKERLNDWIDDALNADERRAVRSHLDGCAACRAELSALETMLADLRDLPESIEPPRDLWPAIDERLGEPTPVVGAVLPAVRRKGRPRVAQWAALAASLVAVAWLGQQVWRSTGGHAGPDTGTADPVTTIESASPDRSAADAVRPAVTTPGVDPVEKPSQAARALEEATEELRRALEVQRDSLPAATLDVVDHNLAIIETAIGEIERAMHERPDDPELNRRLLAYREREVALLRAVSRAANRLES